jgi:signal transduction histidine kinase
VEKNKAENLKLQKDNTEKRYQLIQQNLRFYGAVSIFIVLALVAFLWYKRRKGQQERETQEAIRETQRKASKKVHDTLANDIYRIMKVVQHEPALDKDALVDDIDEVYQRARDISYEIIQSSDEHFYEKISELLKSFATDDIKVVLVGNSKELWQKVDNVYKVELKYILQELMVNMQKHSQADNVVIKFALKGGRCHISYFDNGIGIPNGTPQKNGLRNTGNRIKWIGGQITFDADAGKGLQIQITFPTT